MADFVSDIIHHSGELPLKIGSVTVRNFDKIEIEDILLNDLAGDTLASIKKANVNLSLWHLLHDKVKINTITLAHPDIRIRKEHANAKTNIELLLARFARNDSTTNPLPDIVINQLHIYDGVLRYDVLDSKKKDINIFSPDHIAVSALSANLSVKKLSSDTAAIYIRRISGKEAGGLHLKRLTAHINASKQGCTIRKFAIEFPNGSINSREITASYIYTDDDAPTIKEIKYNGILYSTKFAPSELASLFPKFSIGLPNIRFYLPFEGTSNSISTKNMALYTNDNSLTINASLSAVSSDNTPAFHADISRCDITYKGMTTLCKLLNDSVIEEKIPAEIGKVSLTGNLSLTENMLNGHAGLSSGCGDVQAIFKSEKRNAIDMELHAHALDLRSITGNTLLDKCNIASSLKGEYNDSSSYKATFSATVSDMAYNGYTYAPIDITGDITPDKYIATASTDDSNLTAIATAIKSSKNGLPEYKLLASVDSVTPFAIGLSDREETGTISFNLETEFIGHDIDSALFKANLRNFKLRNKNSYRKINQLYIADNSFGEKRNMIIESDIAKGYILGYYKYSSIPDCINNILHNYMPTSTTLKNKEQNHSSFVFGLDINDSEVVSRLFNLPVTIHRKSSITGSCDESHSRLMLTAELNDTEFLGRRYSRITANAESGNDTITGFTRLIYPMQTKHNIEDKNADNEIIFDIRCMASRDTLHNNVCWDTTTSPTNKGDIHFDIALGKNSDGTTETTTHILPSNIIYNDSAWALSGSSIKSSQGHIRIDDFALQSNGRSLTVNGTIGSNNSDSLRVELKQMQLEDIFDIVNFHSVDFGGKATGYVTASSITENPRFASRLQVEQFHFEQGYMGDMTFSGDWDETNQSIRLNGDIKDGEEYHTVANGFVSPANDSININIKTNGTRIEFINHMLRSFIADAEGRASGQINVIGKLSAVNLQGALSAKGRMRIKPIGVTYGLDGDTVRFTHNNIGFDRFRINDLHGNRGFVTGSVRHNNLKRFTCEFDIDAENLLAFEKYGFGDEGFYGTAFVTGNAKFRADDTGIHLNAEVSNNEDSRFIYNAADPERAGNSEFVTIVDRNAKRRDGKNESNFVLNDERNDFSSRLNLDFLLDINPDLQLRVYTSNVTDDYIDLYGSGRINAVYDEKEGFSMKGNMNLSNGTYKFTLQEIFPKKFNILQGSTLNFNGDPFLANLNLNTVYTVPSVPLTDLSISAERRKNVKVNCLMDITGTLQNPNLTLGLELPDGNEEEREMLAGATSTPEQTNMQFIYLIGIGKFYTYDYNNRDGNSQSSTMMESLISSTISGQLNNIMSKITENDSWNFSGNFTTSEKGWNSMEVEGMLQGRLLDNRLLINGNFGYRDNPMANKNFIGDFEVQWLLNRSGNVSLKAYSKTNDRYFSKTTLTTQGAGIMLKKDFDGWKFWKRKKDK